MSTYIYECPKCRKSFTSEKRLIPTMCPECPKGGLVGVLQFVEENETVSNAELGEDLYRIAKKLKGYGAERTRLYDEIDTQRKEIETLKKNVDELRKDYSRINMDYYKLKDAYEAKQRAFGLSEFNTFEQVRGGIAISETLARASRCIVAPDEILQALVAEAEEIKRDIGDAKWTEAQYIIEAIAHVANPIESLREVMERHVEELIKQFDEKYKPLTIGDVIKAGMVTNDKLNPKD